MNRTFRQVLLPAILSFFVTTTRAQSRPYDPLSDRGVQSNSRLHAFWKQKIDSIYNSGEYTSLRASAHAEATRRRRYQGGSLFSGVVHSDVANANRQLALSGFPALNEYAPLLGFGWNSRSGQVLVDFTLQANFGSSSKKDDEKYSVGGGNLFRLDVGVDLLRSERVAVYPYAGLGWRLTSIRYERDVLTKPNGLLVLDAFTPVEVTASSSRVGYQAGLGLDLRIAQRQDGWRSTFLFFKGGLTGAIGGDKYKVDGKTVGVPIRQYDWEVLAGFKFMRPR
ncbi:MAG: hypothetical protein EOO16_04120 [Chitinophagaceae bacterium]|nr:MAG: hypothetical protein EOO16_04120 [Chitinophagaceae bacterium]